MEDKIVNLFLDQFNLINKRFDRLEGRFDRLENRFDKLEDRFDKLEIRLCNVEEVSRETLFKINSIWESGPVTEEMLQDFAKANGLEYKS